jgi:hypothetical protein
MPLCTVEQMPACKERRGTPLARQPTEQLKTIGLMKTLLLFADSSQVNEATTWYINTLATAAASLGYTLEHVTRLADVADGADVLVLECKSACRLCVMRPNAKVWLWMQGLFPEEARLQFSSRSREILWRCFERVSVLRVQGVVMVSQAMRQHFESRYPTLDLKSFVLPCVNAELAPDCFFRPQKYTRPSFVYAGSLHKWQCFPQTLAVFKEVKALLADARLTVFTGEIAKARQMVQELDVEGVEIEHVSLAELQHRLAEFKYGFVLRADHIVNRVATPTKVSSYMAAGVIPIMTRAVHDYNQVLGGVRPMILAAQLDVDQIARDIVRDHAIEHNAQDILCEYRRVFETYFDHRAYGLGLQEFFVRTGL